MLGNKSRKFTRTCRITILTTRWIDGACMFTFARVHKSIYTQLAQCENYSSSVEYCTERDMRKSKWKESLALLALSR